MALLSQLKNQLKELEISATTKIISDIESLKNSAEEQIRKHQKDVDFQTKLYSNSQR